MQKYNDLCFNNFMVSWNTCLLRSGTGKILCNIIYTVIRLNYFKVIVLFLNLIKSHSSSPSKHIAIVILVVPGITRAFKVISWIQNRFSLYSIKRYSIFTYLSLLELPKQSGGIPFCTLTRYGDHIMAYIIQAIQSSLDQVIVPRNSRRE